MTQLNPVGCDRAEGAPVTLMLLGCDTAKGTSVTLLPLGCDMAEGWVGVAPDDPGNLFPPL